MILLSSLLVKINNHILPSINGWLFKFLYSSKDVKIGNSFKCYTFPSVWLTENGKLIIGDNVLFKENVELRVHKNSTLRIDDHVKIDRGVRLLATNNGEIHINKKVRVGMYSVFNGGDSIYIGESTLISGFVYLQTSMHRYDKNENIANQGFFHAPIKLDCDVWLGAHVVVMPGVSLNKGCIVGSNAVVNKSFDENSLVVGVPAKLIKKRI